VVRFSARIVETEAYLGVEDPAAHTFGGRSTPRVRSTYLEGGHAYVYRIYGMHFCLNVVTRTSKHPEAVLIRAVEPLEGLSQMRALRGTMPDKNLTNGPGKFCEAMHIDLSRDGELLTEDTLWIEDDGLKVPRRKIVLAPRIGVAYAGAAALWPLRYYVRDSVFVSKKIKSFTITL
jgi:DNA-3-methyladenine glycosylase